MTPRSGAGGSAPDRFVELEAVDMMLLLLVMLIGAAAVEVAVGPSGRHRGPRRLAPVDTERQGDARHRR